MEEFILRNRKRIITLLVSFVVLTVFGFALNTVYPTDQTVTAQTATTTVSVSAVVEAWLAFQVSTTSLAIQPALVELDGTLNIGSTPNLDISIGTNNPEGWELEIRGTSNGLYSTIRTHTIDSVVGTSTLATGTEGYGANATNTMAGVIICELYDYYGTDDVGEIRSAEDRQVASKSTANSAESVVFLQVKAAATDETPPGADYSDTIILTAKALTP